MLPAGGASQTLPRVVGTSAALAAVLTGERIPAVAALARGFVDEVVPAAQLRARTDELASRLAARPTLAVRAAKTAVWAALDLPLDVGLRREADLAATLRM
jgi:enoyl-CoA hydratase